MKTNQIGWVHESYKPKTNIYRYEHNKLRCIIADSEEGKLATTVELFVIDTEKLHYYFFHLPTRKFLGHIETPCSSDNGNLDTDLGLLVEYKEDLFSLDHKSISTIYLIRQILGEYL